MAVVRARVYNIQIHVGDAQSSNDTSIRFTHIPTQKELSEALDAEIARLEAEPRDGNAPDDNEMQDENILALKRAREVVSAADLAAFTLIEATTPPLQGANVEVRVAGVLVGRVTAEGEPAYCRKQGGKPGPKKAATPTDAK